MPPNGLSLLFSIKTTDGAVPAHFKPHRYFSVIIMADRKALIPESRFVLYPVNIMSKKTHCAPVADFLQTHDRLSGMLPHAARLMAIRQACETALPAWFTGDILQFEKGRLTVGVPSQAVAARLRQKTPLLQAALQDAGWPVEAIRIKVRLKNDHWQVAPAPKKPLPAGAVTELARLADWLKDARTHPALTEAVAAMLARHQPKKA